MFLTKRVFDERIIKIIFAGLLAYYLSPIVFQNKILYLAFMGGCFFIFVFFKRVEYAFCFLLIIRSVLDLFLYKYGFGGLSISQIVGGLFSVLVMIYFVVNRFKVFALGINKIFGVFMLFSFFPVFLNNDFVYGFGYWLRWLQGFLVFNLTIIILINAGAEEYKKKFNIICWSVILSMVLPYVLFLYNYIEGITIVFKGTVRYFTYGSRENEFSYYLLAIFPYCLFLYSVADRGFKRIGWLTFLPIMMWTIYVNNTRTVWIGVSVILLLWAFFKKQYKIVFSVCLLATGLVLFNPKVAHRLEDIPVVINLLNSDKGFFEWAPELMNRRIGLWQSNLHYFIDKSSYIEKLVGNGNENLRKGVVRVIQGGAIRGDDEHNNYLILLMNTGIIGVCSYLIYLFKLFQESFKLLKNTRDNYLKNLAALYIPVICSYIVVGFGTHLLSALTYIYFFSIFGGVIVAGNILEKRDTEKALSSNT